MRLAVALLFVSVCISQTAPQPLTEPRPSGSGRAQDAPAAATLDRIAVVVGKTVITESEVLQEARLEAFLNNAPLNLTPDARRAAAGRLVDQQLIRNEMQVGAYPHPTPEEVESMLQNLRKDRFPTDTEFRAALDRYGVSEALLRAHLAWQLSAIRFTDMRFASVAPPANSNAADPQSANRSATPAPDVDQQLDSWLKQTRAATRVVFKDGAFQ